MPIGVKKETWASRIRRAELLASQRPESNELLTFYAALLRCQKEIYESLCATKSWLPSGELGPDLPVLKPLMMRLLHAVQANGPDALATQARSLLQADDSDIFEMLIE